jgi:hypothetical protein
VNGRENIFRRFCGWALLPASGLALASGLAAAQGFPAKSVHAVIPFGAAEVARSAPDGHVLLFVSNTHLISAALYRNLPYDGVRDFTPIIEMGSAPNVVVVHPSVRAETLAELFALAKAAPGQLTYASSGNGSTRVYDLLYAFFSRAEAVYGG